MKKEAAKKKLKYTLAIVITVSFAIYMKYLGFGTNAMNLMYGFVCGVYATLLIELDE